ncbi:hypothetical protein BKA67DRAFT_659728 [Truncatella angustata]|uniref:Uncharacterized protein n=1 Tax=Truncatella angustata TaxID=152316 RepID=A0A9P8ZWJ0_9PEZI|nr:uncharacterized protein BKA67DRAFT_659728 [Truncatella angustata]KAH6653086.1 hypothetical protein BKA67DRAFT_659728 [Truncatella angustata]
MAFQDGVNSGAGLAIRANAASYLNPRAGQPQYSIAQQQNGTNATIPTATANLFLDSFPSDDFEFVASVVTACPDQTVYAVRCTKGPDIATLPGFGGEIDSGCKDHREFTITQNPSLYIHSTVAPYSYMPSAAPSASNPVSEGPWTTQTKSFWETCELHGTTSALCDVSVRLMDDFGTTTMPDTGSALYQAAGTMYHRYDVAITAGAEKTANPTGTCAPVPTAAAAGLSAKAAALWALTGVIGLAGILAA